MYFSMRLNGSRQLWRTGYKMCEHAGNIGIFGLCCVNANSLQQSILPSSHNHLPYYDRVSIEAIWSSLSSANTPDQQVQRFQKAWDSPIVKKLSQAIDTSATSDVDRARLTVACAPHSGDWLQAPSRASVWLLLSDEEIRLAVAYRLGTKACSPYTCACGKTVDARGLHGL